MYKKILFVLVINKYNVKKIEDIYIRHQSCFKKQKNLRGLHRYWFWLPFWNFLFFFKLQLYDLTLEEVIFYNMVYDMQKMTKSIHCLRHESWRRMSAKQTKIGWQNTLEVSGPSRGRLAGVHKNKPSSSAHRIPVLPVARGKNLKHRNFSRARIY